MRKLFLCFTILASLALCAFGADSPPAKSPAPSTEKKPAEKKAKPTKTPKASKLKGEVTAMDAKAGTLSVKGATGEKSFTTQDAAKDALERLAVGEQVRVTYSEKDGKTLATSVRRVRPKSASSETKEKKPAKPAPPQTKENDAAKKP